MEKYKWYIEILFKSGTRQKGYYEGNESNSKDVCSSMLEIGKEFPVGSKVFNNMYTDSDKRQVIAFDTTSIDAMVISDKPII